MDTVGWSPDADSLIPKPCPDALSFYLPLGYAPALPSFLSSDLVLAGKVSNTEEGCGVLAKQPIISCGVWGRGE